MGAISRFLLSDWPGESVLLDDEGSFVAFFSQEPTSSPVSTTRVLYRPFLWRANEQSGFNHFIQRMQGDRNPTMRRKRLDFHRLSEILFVAAYKWEREQLSKAQLQSELQVARRSGAACLSERRIA